MQPLHNNQLLHYNIADEVTAFSTMREATLPFPVLQPHQTHDDRVVVVDNPAMTRADLEGVDALVTAMPGFAIGVRTADCVPVLLYDQCHKVVAAIHSGWRGTVARISQKTIRVMAEQFGTVASDIKGVIGPCIGPDSFQVGQEVAEEFRNAAFPMEEILSDRGKRVEGTMQGGLHIDLWQANRWLLTEMGVQDCNIQTVGICTYQHNELFFSARHEGRHCGRIINCIKLGN